MKNADVEKVKRLKNQLKKVQKEKLESLNLKLRANMIPDKARELMLQYYASGYNESTLQFVKVLAKSDFI